MIVFARPCLQRYARQNDIYVGLANAVRAGNPKPFFLDTVATRATCLDCHPREDAGSQ